MHRPADARHHARLLRAQQAGPRRPVLLTRFGGTRLTDLQPDTVNYFKKLPGYDTLRLVLANGSSWWKGHGRASGAAGVPGCAWQAARSRTASTSCPSTRWLPSASWTSPSRCKKPAVVVTDNDGDPAAAAAKYAAYTHHSFIRVCIGKGDPRTLEPQLLAANSLAILNKVLGKNYKTDDDLLKHMQGNKTDCALKIFESPETITMPEYIREAVA